MALLLALMIWFYINQECTEKLKPIDVPLELDLPPKIIGQIEDLQGNPIDTVKVSFEGPSGFLKKERGEIICCHKVELASNIINSQPLIQIEEIKEEDFNLSAQVKIREISPRKIRIILMPEIQRNMTLKVNIDDCLAGNLAKGYEVVSVSAEPSQVLVHGPKHILQHHKEIPIVSIDISERTSSFTQPGRIVPTINKMPVWTKNEFTVTVNIKEQLFEQTFKAKINILLPPDFPYQVKTKPDELEIRLKGSALGIKRLKEHNIKVFVDVSSLYRNPKDIKPGNYNIKVQFRPPEGIILVEPLSPVTLIIETKSNLFR